MMRQVIANCNMVQLSARQCRLSRRSACPQEHKKADVVKHPKVLDHVGLLFNEPLGTAELLFI